MQRPAPEIDVDTGPFWDALAEHRVAVQRCDSCETLRFPPGPVCAVCGSFASTWNELAGRARLLSWVVTHRVAHEGFADRLPYTIAFVELEEQAGLVMYGNLLPPAAAPGLSMPVAACFEDIGDGDTLLHWTPR